MRVGDSAPWVPGCLWGPGSSASCSPTDILPRNPWGISVSLPCIVLSLLFIWFVGWLVLLKPSLIAVTWNGRVLTNGVALIVLGIYLAY